MSIARRYTPRRALNGTAVRRIPPQHAASRFLRGAQGMCQLALPIGQIDPGELLRQVQLALALHDQIRRGQELTQPMQRWSQAALAWSPSASARATHIYILQRAGMVLGNGEHARHFAANACATSKLRQSASGAYAAPLRNLQQQQPVIAHRGRLAVTGGRGDPADAVAQRLIDRFHDARPADDLSRPCGRTS